MSMTAAERARMRKDAEAAFLADLLELEAAGCDSTFADWIAALPDPATDGQEHD